MKLLIRNLLVCSLLFSSAGYAEDANVLAQRAAVEAERAAQQAAEAAKQVAQNAAIEAVQQRITAQNGVKAVIRALPAVEAAAEAAQSAANVTLQTGADVATVEQAFTETAQALAETVSKAEVLTGYADVVITAALAAENAAEDASAAAETALALGLINWIQMTEQAAIKAEKNSVLAAGYASTSQDLINSALLAVASAEQALASAEQAYYDVTYTGTNVADWDWSVWELEGFDPIVDNSMVFDALAAQHTTSSGNGWRHEVKIKTSERVAMTEVYEDFSANVKLNLSTGSKTIIAQHHANDTGTIMKLYVADSNESGFHNSIANDGIFDVFVRLLNIDGSGEQKFAFGTIKSGDRFDFQVINDHGFVSVMAMGETFALEIEDSPASYLKFGNYLQAQDAETGDKVTSSDDFAQFYADAGITESKVTFTNLSYVRVVDDEIIDDIAGQSVAITDTASDSAGKIRINLDSALPTGKVSVNVRYSEREIETTYLTLFGASTSSSNAVADLKMDSGYSAADGNVGIKLRSTGAWIADYSASEWSNIAVSWDSLVGTFTVAVNGTEIGTYDMNLIDSVEKIELKLASDSNTTKNTFYVDDINVYADIAGTDVVFFEDFESIVVGTDLSGYDSNYSSSTNSATITDLANANGYAGPVVDEPGTATQSVAITDTATDSAGKLRIKLDDALPIGKVSVNVKYSSLESETAYLTLYGSSTSSGNAVADLKMDSGYSTESGNVGIKLRSTGAWIADFSADEWATITVAWDNATTNTFTVAINDVEIGTYAMYNNFDVEKIEVKLASDGNTTEHTLYVDDLAVYSDTAATTLVFFDDFEAIDVGTSLTGYGTHYDSKTNSAVVNNVENATVIEISGTQSVSITDTATDSAGKLRLKLDEALPTGKVSVNVKYSSLESETAYLTLYGSSTSSGNAVADLKMDSGYSAESGNVGIKLRSTGAWIADFPADEWATITVAWDNVTTHEFTVTINGERIGSYAMYNQFDVEKIELKLASDGNTTEHTLYVDNLAVYSDAEGADLVFFDDFEAIDVDTSLTGYGANYDSKTNSAIVNNVESAEVVDVVIIEEETPVNQSVAITDTSDLSSGKLRLDLDTPMSVGKLSVNVKYAAEESETAYIALYGSSTSTGDAVADLKMDSGYKAETGNVGIRLRSTDTWIADFAAGEWNTITVAWDNVTTNKITVTINDVLIGSYAMYNNFDVEKIDFKLGSTAKVANYIFFIDDIAVYADTLGDALVFADDFESTPLDTDLSGYGNNYNSSTVSAVVTDQVDALIIVPVVDDEDIIYTDVNPDLAPSDNFDLSQWYVSIPTDEDGNGKADNIKEDTLNAAYENHEYFYSEVDGGMVFRCYVDGFKTSTGTSYTRTELREMIRAGDTSIDTQGINGNNWVFSSAPVDQQARAGGVDGNMKATLAVNHVTTTGDSSQVGRVIVGQIHAAVDEPIRLYYRLLPGHTKGSIYFAHEPSNENDEQWYEMIGGKSSSQDEPEDGIELNEQFSYEIDVAGNIMTVSIMRDGKDTITQEVDMTDSGYDGYYIDEKTSSATYGEELEDYMYFKAGVYNQNNTGDATDSVQATFYSLEQTHN